MNHLINNLSTDGAGPTFHSTNPATGDPVWTGHAATASEINDAIQASRRAQPAWADLPLERRITHLESFAQSLRSNDSSLADAISR